MYSIQTIGTLRHHPVISYLLQINPAAVYIDLVRNAILETQRKAAPGAKPYNARICDLFYHNPKLVNASAYCHPTITTNLFFSSRRRHTIWTGDWSSDVCSSD